MAPQHAAFVQSESSLNERVRWVRQRIEAACARAGRDPKEVTLIAVSKTFSPEAVRSAHAEGILDFGENRVQELVAKAEEVPADRQGGVVRWHMIGHLQRNKAREVVRIASLFHALHSERLAGELSRRAGQAGRVMDCLIQVNTSGEETKEGVAPEAVEELIQNVSAFEGIRLRGFMTVAAPAEDPEEVRHEFRRLRGIRDRQREIRPDLPLDFLSMGMSGDLEVAIEEGATHVRLGRLLFGSRT